MPSQTRTDDDMPEPLQSPLLDNARPHGIRHGFFTRKGGVSEGIYSGLNTGVGSADDQQRVAENPPPRRGLDGCRSASASLRPPDPLAGRRVATGPFGPERPKADAIVHPPFPASPSALRRRLRTGALCGRGGTRDRRRP